MNRKQFIESLFEEINKSLAAEDLPPLSDEATKAVVDAIGTAIFAVAHMVENLAVATKKLDALVPRGVT